MDADELVVAADGVLLHRVHLGSHDQVNRLLLVGRQVEPPVLVGLAGGWVGVLGRVVEGVGVGHGGLGRLALVDDLVGKVVVDVGGLLGEGVGLVDGVLATVGGIKRSVDSVLVDRHHVESGIIALVQEDLVAVSRNDDIPGVHGAGRAHEHGEDAVGGKDGGLVLVGELLDDGIGRGGDVVGGSVDGGELPLGTLDGRLVVGAVVVVEETVVVDILAIVGVEVQLGQTVKVNLLKQLPLGLDVDAGIAVASRLVIVLPAEATTAGASVGPAAPVVASVALSTTSTSPLELLPSTSGAAGLALATSTSTGEDSTTAVPCLGRVSDVADDGEGGFVLGGRSIEGDGVARAVNLLICMTYKPWFPFKTEDNSLPLKFLLYCARPPRSRSLPSAVQSAMRPNLSPLEKGA